MRSKNRDMMKEIMDCINEFFLENQRTPSAREIAERINLSKSSIQRYLVAMDEEGMLNYSAGTIETDYIRKFGPDEIYAPLAGGVVCGDPNVEEVQIESYIRLDPIIFGRKNYYILVARRDSMEDEGIEDGDYLVIESGAVGVKNDIVVALDDEGQNTLKRFGGRNEDGKYVLEYCNEAVYPRKVILVDSFTCQGVLRFIIKKRQ